MANILIQKPLNNNKSTIPGLFSVNYDTGEIFRSTVPDDIREAMSKWGADKNKHGDLAMQNAVFQTIYKTNPKLANSMLWEKGYNAFNNALNAAYQPVSVGFVPGTRGYLIQNGFGGMNRFLSPQQRQQFAAKQVTPEQQRQLIDNWVQNQQQSGQGLTNGLLGNGFPRDEEKKG